MQDTGLTPSPKYFNKPLITKLAATTTTHTKPPWGHAPQIRYASAYFITAPEAVLAKLH